MGALDDISEYLRRSGSGLKRGYDDTMSGWGSATDEMAGNMQDALSGVRVVPGAIMTDAGYVDPRSWEQGGADSGMERVPDIIRALELFGSAMAPGRVGGIAAKTGTEGKTASSIFSNMVTKQGEYPKVDVDYIVRLLQDNGITPTLEYSKSMSDRHGPSASAYVFANGKKIRVSDHPYESGSDLDLRFGSSGHDAEYKIGDMFGFNVSDAAKDAKEIYNRRLSEWEAARNAERISHEAELEKAANNNRLLNEAGLGHLTGDSRRNALKRMKSSNRAVIQGLPVD